MMNDRHIVKIFIELADDLCLECYSPEQEASREGFQLILTTGLRLNQLFHEKINAKCLIGK